MKLEYVPLLQLQRDLYDKPRTPARFKEYLDTLTDERGDMALPLSGVNPMGKGHLPALLDDYLALGGDGIGAEVTAVAEKRLGLMSGAFRTALVLADDLHGGWTNRYATELGYLCRTKGVQRRGWLVGHLWSSEAATAELVGETLFMGIYRGAYIAEHGYAETLQEILAQESYAWHLTAESSAENLMGVLDEEDLDYTTEVLASYLQSDQEPVLIAALFGDVGAHDLGYEPLGLSERAGLKLARQMRL